MTVGHDGTALGQSLAYRSVRGDLSVRPSLARVLLLLAKLQLLGDSETVVSADTIEMVVRMGDGKRRDRKGRTISTKMGRRSHRSARNHGRDHGRS